MHPVDVDGIYTDPFHSPIHAGPNMFGSVVPWYGGLRILARRSSSDHEFLCVGCDDGLHWWVLYGTGLYLQANGSICADAVQMDFAPKAPAVGLLHCRIEPGKVLFLKDDKSVANTWSRLTATAEFALEPQRKHATFNEINGLYVDAAFRPGSFAGMRVFSDRRGKSLREELVLIGSDDGLVFWVIEVGKWEDMPAGRFSIGKYAGTVKEGVVTMNDGAVWTKMGPRTDFHEMPKE